jgi:amino acid permease
MSSGDGQRAAHLLSDLEEEEELPTTAESWSPGGNMNQFRVLVVLLNLVIGVGLLGIPYCFRTGVFVELLVVAFFGAASYFSFVILIDCSSKMGYSIDFAHLMRDSFTTNLEWIPHLVLFITFFGFAIVHFQSAGSLLKSCLEESGLIPTWLSDNRWIVIGVPATVIGIPLILLRSLRGFSHVSMVTCGLICLYLVHSAVYLVIYTRESGFNPDGTMKLFQFNKFFIKSLSVQAFAFACHPLIGPTLERLTNPTWQRQYSTMLILAICASGCYALGGLLPYLTLFDRILDPVVFVYYGPGQVFTIVTKALYAIFLIITSPLILYSARLALNDFIFRKPFTTLKWALIGIALILGGTILAITVTSIPTMFGFIGGVTCNLIVYTLPAIYYIRICTDGSRWKRIVSWAMIAVGTVAMAVCLYDSIASLVRKDV